MTNCHDCRPSPYIADARTAFCERFSPGKPVSFVDLVYVLAKLNTAHEVATELEAEFEILANIPTPVLPAAPLIEISSANVVPFRPRPRLVVGGSDGGDAA